MNSSGDEFDAYNFQEFTAEDLALVDESIVSRGNVAADANRGGPAIAVEVEQPADQIISNRSLMRASSSNANVLLSTRRQQVSPFQRYRRWNKVLSVSDLVSPAW
jgi:hypothetical protein